MATTRIKVDRKKMQELVDSGISIEQIANDIGRSNDQVKRMWNGTVTNICKPDWLAIKTLYNVDVELKESELQKENEEKSVPQFDVDYRNFLADLRELIESVVYKATYRAVKDAWEDAPTLEEREKEMD